MPEVLLEHLCLHLVPQSVFSSFEYCHEKRNGTELYNFICPFSSSVPPVQNLEDLSPNAFAPLPPSLVSNDPVAHFSSSIPAVVSLLLIVLEQHL